LPTYLSAYLLTNRVWTPLYLDLCLRRDETRRRRISYNKHLARRRRVHFVTRYMICRCCAVTGTVIKHHLCWLTDSPNWSFPTFSCPRCYAILLHCACGGHWSQAYITLGNAVLYPIESLRDYTQHKITAQTVPLPHNT